jgi:basic membrane protein A
MTDVDSVVADFDVIVLPGFQFAEISTRAAANPSKYFILIDAHPDEYNGQTEFPNVLAMQFREQESGFFAGIAAAMETSSNKVAFIGGMAFPPVVNYQFGFEAGVMYANTNLNTRAEIINIAAFAGTDVTGASIAGNYVQSFGDAATGKIVAEALIAEGADILFVAAGMSGNGAFTAAMEAHDVYVIGCDVDQYGDGYFAGGNVVLTSALKNMRINVFRGLEQVAAGTFRGGNHVMGADTDSSGFVSADGRHQMNAYTVAAMYEAYDRVKSGEYVPPGNFNPGNLPR